MISDKFISIYLIYLFVISSIIISEGWTED